MSGALVLMALATSFGAAPSIDAAEAHLVRRVSGQVLELAQGETALLEIRAPLKELPSGALVVTIAQTTRISAISVLPWSEEISTESDRRGKPLGRALVPVRVSATASPGET